MYYLSLKKLGPLSGSLRLKKTWKNYDFSKISGKTWKTQGNFPYFIWTQGKLREIYFFPLFDIVFIPIILSNFFFRILKFLHSVINFSWLCCKPQQLRELLYFSQGKLREIFHTKFVGTLIIVNLILHYATFNFAISPQILLHSFIPALIYSLRVDYLYICVTLSFLLQEQTSYLCYSKEFFYLKSGLYLKNWPMLLPKSFST